MITRIALKRLEGLFSMFKVVAVTGPRQSGKTVHDEFFKNLRYWLKLTGEKQGKIIYAGNENQKRSEGIEVISWEKLSLFD